MIDIESPVEISSQESEMIFRRGDKVNYLGDGVITEVERWNEEEQEFEEIQPEEHVIKPVKGTYVHATLHHGISRYVIQHPNGFSKEHFLKDYLKGRFDDGFEAVHSSQLKSGLKFIWASPDDLELVERKK